jgi:pimeloyl-ACP methyl ester carboxylesterase
MESSPAPAPSRRRPLSRQATRLAVRGGIRSLSAVAPSLAVETAVRLMLRPGRPAPVRPADRAVHERARGGALAVGREHVVTYRWGDPDAPAVLLAHGWQLRASRMAALVTPLEAAGLRVVAFDAVAHGDSTGRRTNVLEMAAVLRALADDVAARGGEVAGVVGHSLGGLAAGIAVREGLPAPRWVAIAAPTGVESMDESYASMAALPARLVPALHEAAARHLFDGDREAWARVDLVARPAPPDRAALFVRDVDDTFGRPGDSRRLHAAHPGSELVVTSGSGHNRVLDHPEVHEAVVAHLTSVRVPG